MKKFLFKTLYFFLPIIIISYPFDYIVSSYLNKSNRSLGEFEVMDDIYNSKANCDIAIYGSSRAWVHFDPKIISDSLNCKVYNFGNDGHAFDLLYLRHLEFLKHNNKPKTIILSVDVLSFRNPTGLYEAGQYLPYMLWNFDIERYTRSYNYYSRLEYFIPAVRYSGKRDELKIVSEYITKGVPAEKYRHNGYLGMDLEWNGDFDRVKAKMQAYRIKWDQERINLFDKFVNECKEMGINLILVYTPEYIEGQKFVTNRKELIKLYKKFAKKYNLKFYDYSNDEICFDKTLFYNAIHMNKKAAEIFTSKFSHVLKTELKIDR